MASGTAVSTVLATLKGHAVAVAVVGAVVVGTGAAAAAVATGHAQLPGQTTAPHGKQSQDQATDRAKACADNGDAKRLAGTYAPMFDHSAQKAQDAICAIFVNKEGSHAIGFGEIRQALNIAATIESSKQGATDCLTATSAPGKSGSAGKPADPGKPTL